MRLTSDPTKGPLLEANIVAPGGQSCVTGVELIDGGRDRTYRRPDGGDLVSKFQKRASLRVQFSGMDVAERDALQELAREIEPRRDHGNTWVDPIFRPSTLAAAPLQTGLGGWVRDETTGGLAWDSAAVTFSRASTAWALNSDGRLVEYVSGAPRLEPAVLGMGLRLDPATSNLFSPAYPTSGSSGWTGGSQTWIGSTRGPIAGETGAYLISGSTAVSASPSVTLAAGDNVRVGVWVRATCDVRLRVLLTNSSVDTSAYKGRTSTAEWTWLSLRAEATSAETVATVLLNAEPEGSEVPSLEYAGGYFDKVATYNAPPRHWADAATVADSAVLDVAGSSQTLTVSGAFVLPAESSVEGSFFRLRDSGGATLMRAYLGIGGDLRMAYHGLPTELVSSAFFGSSHYGLPCYATFAIGAGRARMRLAVASSDGRSVTTLVDQELDPAATDSMADIVGVELSPTYAGGGSTLPSWVQVDAEYPTTAGILARERSFLVGGFRDIFARTAGREFHLSGLQMRPNPGRPDLVDGQFTLTEIDRNVAAMVAR